MLEFDYPEDAYNEARMLGSAGRARGRLVAEYNARLGDPSRDVWARDYFKPLLVKVNERWGEAFNIASSGVFIGTVPPWAGKVDSAQWDGAKVRYIKEVDLTNKGSVKAYLLHLKELVNYDKMSFNERVKFDDVLVKARIECDGDMYWDNKIVLPRYKITEVIK
jgi:hypothetical protein